MQIGLDIDGVLADWAGAFCQVAHANGYGEHFPVRWQDCKAWDFAPRNLIMEVWEKHTDHDFYLNLPTMPDAQLHFKPLAYVTARNIPTEITEAWLFRNGFPSAPVRTVGYNQSKVATLEGLGIDTFVEDRAEAAIELNANGILCYLLNRPWNVNVDCGDVPRINHLSEIQLNG